MKPDSYMPLFGNDLFMAIDAHGSVIGWAYLHTIWHYWHHNHCKGLKDDDDYLRGVCGCELNEWAKVRSVVFDNDEYFTLGTDGLWHQKFADELWDKATEQYDKKINRARAGARERWRK